MDRKLRMEPSRWGQGPITGVGRWVWGLILPNKIEVSYKVVMFAAIILGYVALSTEGLSRSQECPTVTFLWLGNLGRS